MSRESDYQQRIREAVERGTQRHSDDVDVSGYPVDVQEILQVVCELWHLRPPRTKKSKAYWIQSARELLDACGEFGEGLVYECRNMFEDYMRTNNGLAPFRVEGPGSLIKYARSLAGESRDAIKADSEEYRRRYVKGELADWIEH